MFLNSLKVSKSQSISRIHNLSAKAIIFQGSPSQYMTIKRQEDVLDTIFHLITLPMMSSSFPHVFLLLLYCSHSNEFNMQ